MLKIRNLLVNAELYIVNIAFQIDLWYFIMVNIKGEWLCIL